MRTGGMSTHHARPRRLRRSAESRRGASWRRWKIGAHMLVLLSGPAVTPAGSGSAARARIRSTRRKPAKSEAVAEGCGPSATASMGGCESLLAGLRSAAQVSVERRPEDHARVPRGGRLRLGLLGGGAGHVVAGLAGERVAGGRAREGDDVVQAHLVDVGVLERLDLGDGVQPGGLRGDRLRREGGGVLRQGRLRLLVAGGRLEPLEALEPGGADGGLDALEARVLRLGLGGRRGRGLAEVEEPQPVAQVRRERVEHGVAAGLGRPGAAAAGRRHQRGEVGRRLAGARRGGRAGGVRGRSRRRRARVQRGAGLARGRRQRRGGVGLGGDEGWLRARRGRRGGSDRGAQRDRLRSGGRGSRRGLRLGRSGLAGEGIAERAARAADVLAQLDDHVAHRADEAAQLGEQVAAARRLLVLDPGVGDGRARILLEGAGCAVAGVLSSGLLAMALSLLILDGGRGAVDRCRRKRVGFEIDCHGDSSCTAATRDARRKSNALANAHVAPVWREVAYLPPHTATDQGAITALCPKELTTGWSSGRAISPSIGRSPVPGSRGTPVRRPAAAPDQSASYFFFRPRVRILWTSVRSGIWTSRAASVWFPPWRRSASSSSSRLRSCARVFSWSWSSAYVLAGLRPSPSSFVFWRTPRSGGGMEASS